MDLSDLTGIAITFVVIGLLLAFGIQVQGDVKNDFGAEACAANNDGKNYTTFNETNQLCTNSTGFTKAYFTSEYNASDNAIDANATLASKLSVIGLVIAAAIIVGVLLKSFRQ